MVFQTTVKRVTLMIAKNAKRKCVKMKMTMRRNRQPFDDEDVMFL